MQFFLCGGEVARRELRVRNNAVKHLVSISLLNNNNQRLFLLPISPETKEEQVYPKHDAC